MPDVPYLANCNTIDALVKFYKPLGGYVTAGSREDEYFIVRLPNQKRIHFYEMVLDHGYPCHVRFRSEGHYDKHSRYWINFDIETRLKMGWEVDGCQVLPEYDPVGIYFGYALPCNEDGYLKHFWRIVFPDQTWVRCSNISSAAQYIRNHGHNHGVKIPTQSVEQPQPSALLTPYVPPVADPDYLWLPQNNLFYKQQVILWSQYLLAGSPTLDVIDVSEDDIASEFTDRITPHDFIERLIQKHDLLRPDLIELRGKEAPVCPYHEFSKL